MSRFICVFWTAIPVKNRIDTLVFEYDLENICQQGWAIFFKNQFYFIQVNKRALFLLTFFISISILANWLDIFIRDVYGVEPGVTLEGHDLSGWLKEEVRGLVMEMAMQEQLLPQEPQLDKKTGQIYPERNGVAVDWQATLNEVMHAPPGKSVRLIRNVLPTKYCSTDLQSMTASIGSYQTSIYGSYQRSTNISLAAAAVNNTLLWPEEEFSFNEVVGPRTAERGYMPAPVIIMGANNLDYGGGVCQVSSTIYNAALAAKLQIIERHSHSIPVYYVPPDFDASVDYGYLDLRIKNDTNSPLIMKSGVSQGKVWVSILGRGK